MASRSVQKNTDLNSHGRAGWQGKEFLLAVFHLNQQVVQTFQLQQRQFEISETFNDGYSMLLTSRCFSAKGVETPHALQTTHP